MKKYVKFVSVVAVLVAIVALAGATAAFAQGPQDPDDVTPQRQNRAQYGPGEGLNLMAVDEADMHAAIAKALGIDVMTLEDELEAGKTLYVLAQELNVDFDEVRAAMNAVHAEALNEAVAAGTISQEQATWMLGRRGGQNGQAAGLANGLQGRGVGRGAANGLAQGVGRGPGANAGFGGFSGECPNVTP